MFGLIIAGRPVSTNMIQVDATRFTFELLDANNINHIVVFLTGQSPFPPGFAATVHFLWPNLNAAPTWQLLGFISNAKPSAVFKLGTKRDSAVITPLQIQLQQQQQQMMMSSTDSMMEDATTNSSGGNNVMSSSTSASAVPLTASLGISIEPEDVVMRAVAELTHAKETKGTDLVVSSSSAQTNLPLKLMENLYNYCSSFAAPLASGSVALLDWGNTYIPIKALEEWYMTISRKLKLDPTGSFLRG